MTDFQKRIRDYLASTPNRWASTFEVAQAAFPEKWKKAAGRGALIVHIRAAAEKISGAHYHPAKTYPGDGHLSLDGKA